ncbi:MAG: hypothetical protein JJE10_08965, partial [Thermoleophilia bacterium]|nr:hypothetical protein [Thermoleophilia bacterium]
AIGLAVVGAIFQSLQRAELESELDKAGVNLDGKETQQLDGLLAGSQEAIDAISQDSPSVTQQIEQVAADAFTYALGNAIWVLVGVLAVCAVLTWWLVAPKQKPYVEPEAAQTPEHHHHRFGGFHL